MIFGRNENVPKMGTLVSKGLKQSEVIPVYKKLDLFFERVIYNQINSFMEKKISKYVTGLRKSHGTQHSLIVMLENGKKH